MPATPRYRLNNPLRKLRLILGEEGKPVHQESFANHVGMSVATLRAIESNRRPFSEDCQLQIFISLLARWDPQKKGWYLGDTETPYEKEHVSFGYRFDPHDRYVDDYNIHQLIERLLAMFKSCPTRDHHRGLLMRLFRHLRETAESYRLRVDLSPTEPRWMQTPKPKVWGKPLAKDVVFWAVYDSDAISPHQDAGGIFDFRSRRSFRPDDYPEGRPEPEKDETVHKSTADTEPSP